MQAITHSFISGFKAVIAQRPLALVLLGLIVLSVGVTVYVSVTIQPNELQVITQYTAYGVQHFYRGHWLYLLSFACMAVMIGIFGVMVAVKLLMQERASLAMVIGWTFIALQAVLLATYVHIIEYA